MKPRRVLAAALVVGALALGAAPTAQAAAPAVPVAHPLGSLMPRYAHPLDLAFDAQGYLYVASQPTTDGSDSVIQVYNARSTGNAAPLRTLSGPHTGLKKVAAITVDTKGYLYVGSSDDSISVFAPGAHGDAKPVRKIAGPATQLYAPSKLVVGPDGSLYAADPNNNAIERYAPNANGNARPTGRLAGSATQLDLPVSMSLAPDGSLVVGSFDKVLVFAKFVGGNTKPTRVFTDKDTPLDIVVATAVDTAGNIYTLSWGMPGVSVYPAGASGAVSALHRFGGSDSGMQGPIAMVVDADRRILVDQLDAQRIDTFAAQMPLSKPTAVRSVKVTGSSKTSRTVSWQAPSRDGGAPVTSYTIVVKHGSKTISTKHVSGSKHLIALSRSVFAPGRNTIYVSAVTRAGAGPSVHKTVTVKFSKPGKVRSLHVTGTSSGPRTVKWKAPSSSGGKPVAHYTIVVKHGSKVVYTKVVKASSHKLTIKRPHLTSGLDTVSVKAKTVIGSSKWTTVRIYVR